MGILDALRNALALPALASGALAVPPASAWADPNHLITVGTPDVPLQPVNRAVAMSVPALARARRIIATSIARCPLQVQDADGPVAEQPPWVSRTDGPVSPYHRMLWTVDDLLFYGWSLWAVERDTTGAITAADRVPFEQWSFDPDGDISFLGKTVDEESVILIPGADEGILAYPSPIRHAARLAESADRAARSGIAHTELHQTGGEPITEPDQIRAIIAAWVAGRNNPDGAVGFTNTSIEARTHGSFDGHLLVEGRNAAAIDIARICGIPAMLLDAANADNTVRYSNVDARNSELVDYCLGSFMAPIAARLGLDDVLEPGQSVQFDLDQLTGLDPHTVAPPDDSQPQPRPRPTQEAIS